MLNTALMELFVTLLIFQDGIEHIDLPPLEPSLEDFDINSLHVSLNYCPYNHSSNNSTRW